MQFDIHALKVWNAEKQKNAELDRYVEARRHGIQPATTKLHDTIAAEEAAS